MLHRRAPVCCILLWASSMIVVSGQGFLREGFANQMEGDFKGETKLEENELPTGMTREMFLIQDVDWEIRPMDFGGSSSSSRSKSSSTTTTIDSKLQAHVQSFLKHPIRLSLSKKKGKYGLKAVGMVRPLSSTGKENRNNQKLRAYWRQGIAGVGHIKGTDYLDMTYEAAVRSRLPILEFEIQLPPLNKVSKAENKRCVLLFSWTKAHS